MIKMIVIDLDGTLLTRGVLSPADARVLEQIQEKGIKLMVATGRNLSDAAGTIDKLKLRQYGGAIACSDGQYLEDFADQSFLEYEFLNYSRDVKHVLTLGLPDNNQMRAFCKSGDYQVFRSVFSRFYIKNLIKSILTGRKMTGALFAGNDYPIGDIEKIVLYARESAENTEKLSAQYEAAYVHDSNRYEIKRKGVNKGASVESIQKKYGFGPEEIAVFGNDENDVSMFERYPNSFAVDDAPESVKGKANRVIPSGKVADAVAALVQEGALQ